MTEKTIIAALAKLDVSNDAHWTGDGLPRIETVRLFAGDSALSRDDVTMAAPQFTRQAPALPGVSQDDLSPSGTGADTQDAVKTGGDDAQDGIGDGTNTSQASEQETSVKTVTVPETAADRLANAAAAKAKADQAYQEAQQAMDAEIDRAAKSGPAETFAQQVAAYHRMVKGQLQARAEQKARLRDAGINLKDLIPSRAPIDAALDRKKGRGTQRPVMPRR